MGANLEFRKGAVVVGGGGGGGGETRGVSRGLIF